MIRINDVGVPLDFSFREDDLRKICAEKLGIREKNILSVRLVKKSVDARRKSDIHFTISVELEVINEKNVLKTGKAVGVQEYSYNIKNVTETERPIIVGFGPSGMFCGLVLAMAGAKPIILERGGDIDRRVKSVEKFRRTGTLDTECNVQFGEGGAGTFSDGKLNTGIKDFRIRWILEKFAEHGAPENILYLAKPHIGTDKLREVVKKIREEIISLGGEVLFNSRFCGFDTDGDCIKSAKYTRGGVVREIETENIVLATGHSARDVFEILRDKKAFLTRKPFSVGVRIEHLREDINRAMYGSLYRHPALGSADYKLAVHLPNGRSLYTFCMCPGGYVIASASEKNGVVVNGMSCYKRNAENSNSALLVNVNPQDFHGDDPLAGVYFQRDIEQRAFLAGGGNYVAPVIKTGDFLSGGLTENFGRVRPSYTPDTAFARPEKYLPEFVCETLKLGIVSMGKKIKGFDDPDSLLTGAETRSSSPVRIERDSVSMQSVSFRGLYPCGEGAGYAGGIVSAGVDGMRVAEKIIDRLRGEV